MRLLVAVCAVLLLAITVRLYTPTTARTQIAGFFNHQGDTFVVLQDGRLYKLPFVPGPMDPAPQGSIWGFDRTDFRNRTAPADTSGT